nr:universal stress protein [Heliophilum fasciatum]
MGQRVLDKTEAVFQAAGLTCKRDLTMGNPAYAICEYAEEHNMDLIIIGSRGMGEIKSLLLGSISDRVLHLAKCPVLIVR